MNPAPCSSGLPLPCFSLLSNWRDIEEMPVLQGFLAYLANGTLFFSKITLILT